MTGRLPRKGLNLRWLSFIALDTSICFLARKIHASYRMDLLPFDGGIQHSRVLHRHVGGTGFSKQGRALDRRGAVSCASKNHSSPKTFLGGLCLPLDRIRLLPELLALSDRAPIFRACHLPTSHAVESGHHRTCGHGFVWLLTLGRTVDDLSPGRLLATDRHRRSPLCPDHLAHVRTGIVCLAALLLGSPRYGRRNGTTLSNAWRRHGHL